MALGMYSAWYGAEQEQVTTVWNKPNGPCIHTGNLTYHTEEVIAQTNLTVAPVLRLAGSSWL